MRSRAKVVLVFVLASALPIIQSCSPAGCGKDTDCIDGRICDNGECVSNPNSSGTGSGTGGQTTCRADGEQCQKDGDCCSNFCFTYYDGTGHTACMESSCGDHNFDCMFNSDCCSNICGYHGCD